MDPPRFGIDLKRRLVRPGGFVIFANRPQGIPEIGPSTRVFRADRRAPAQGTGGRSELIRRA